jgi:phage terminase large subunit GpA-like protein
VAEVRRQLDAIRQPAQAKKPTDSPEPGPVLYRERRAQVLALRAKVEALAGDLVTAGQASAAWLAVRDTLRVQVRRALRPLSPQLAIESEPTAIRNALLAAVDTALQGAAPRKVTPSPPLDLGPSPELEPERPMEAWRELSLVLATLRTLRTELRLEASQGERLWRWEVERRAADAATQARERLRGMVTGLAEGLSAASSPEAVEERIRRETTLALEPLDRCPWSAGKEAPDAGVIRAMVEGLRPPPRLYVDEWADRYRQLTSTSAGQPGQWRTARAPYLREPMRRLSAYDPARTVVVMKGSQLGFTEVILNWIGCLIHLDPMPVMVVTPSLPVALKWSKQRLAPMVAATPELAQRVAKPRGKEETSSLLEKQFPGGMLFMVGANSASSLRSMPIAYIAFDEVDGYVSDVEDEGSPVDLALRRQTSFSRRKTLMVSTPKTKGESRIEAEYLASDQRRYFVPCLACGAEQLITWQGIRWQGDDYRTARWHCAECDHPHRNSDKEQLLERGEWRPTAPGDGETVGYHLSGLYAPHGWDSWENCVKLWLKAQGDPVLLKSFVNTVLGETWEDAAGQRIDPTGLQKRAEDWGAGCPPGVVTITAGVDVQHDRLEFEIVGWGVGEESWSLAYGVLEGDPTSPEVWADLEDALRSPWPHPRVPGGMRVAAACIDSGHATQHVYNFTERHQSRKWWAVKGSAGEGKAIFPRKKVNAGRSRTSGVHMVGVDQAKWVVANRLRIGAPGPGYCHFPTSRAADWYQQLTSEVRVTRFRRGKRRTSWELPSGRRNEALDCRVYAYAALHGWYLSSRTLEREASAIANREAADRDTWAAGVGERSGRLREALTPSPSVAPSPPPQPESRQPKQRAPSYWKRASGSWWDR